MCFDDVFSRSLYLNLTSHKSQRCFVRFLYCLFGVGLQVEMEEQKLATQTDYWLVQYQRLLDSKPEALIDQVVLMSSRFF